MKLLRTFIIVCLLAAGFAFMPDQPHVSAACINESGNGDVDVVFGPFSMPAGSTITITMTTQEGVYTAVLIYIDGYPEVIDVIDTATHTIVYTFPVAASEVEVQLMWITHGLPENTYTIVTDDCAAPAQEPLPVPGCDVTIAIPATAVGATINADTAVYWAPGEATVEVFPAGLNVRAIGVDASGMYTKVVYACGYYWVPTGVIGPNYDPPWNGMLLPTDVVE